jgi:hypothetical protein
MHSIFCEDIVFFLQNTEILSTVTFTEEVEDRGHNISQVAECEVTLGGFFTQVKVVGLLVSFYCQVMHAVHNKTCIHLTSQINPSM